AGQFIRSRSIRAQLAAALDYWACWRRRGNENWRALVAICRVADPDPWRNRLRDALERKDPEVLKEVATSSCGHELPAETLTVLAALTRETAAAERTAMVLYQARQRYPGDFWVNHQLAFCLYNLQPPRLEEALRYYTAAVA